MRSKAERYTLGSSISTFGFPVCVVEICDTIFRFLLKIRCRYRSEVTAGQFTDALVISSIFRSLWVQTAVLAKGQLWALKRYRIPK